MNRRWAEISRDALLSPRMAAAAVDGGICFVVMGLATVLAFVLADSVPVLLWVLGFLALVHAFPVAYFALFESSRAQATPGKRLAGIIVESIDGERISFLGAVLRNGLKLVLLLVLAAVFSLPFWLMVLLSSLVIPLDTKTARESAEITITWVSIAVAAVFIVARSGWKEHRQAFYDEIIGYQVVRKHL